MAEIKRIFVVDDHPVFRQGLGQLVKAESDLMVCGSVGSAEEALAQIPRAHPDLVLVDITLPGKSGLDLIKALRGAGSNVKLLVVSMHDEAVYADRVLRAGGDGYVMKEEDPQEIISAIRDVLAGRIYVSEAVLGGSQGSEGNAEGERAETRPLATLSDSELEVLEQLGHGKSATEIAEQLQLTVREVLQSCTRLRRKLALHTDNALVRYAVCWVEGGMGEP